MHTEARVGVLVDFEGQRALSVHGGDGSLSVDGGANRRCCTALHSQLQQQHNSGLQRQPQLDAIHHMLLEELPVLLARRAPPLSLASPSSSRKTSMWREVSRIVYEGFRALWKGNLVTIAHRLPYSSISFYAYEHYKHMLLLVFESRKRRDYVSQEVLVKLIIGRLSGITAASITCPLDLVRTRLAAQT